MNKPVLVLTAAFVMAACGDSVGPRGSSAPPAEFTTGPAGAIVLNKVTGVQGETTSDLGQGFTTGNPDLGDAIIATYFWRGSTNAITRIFDHLSDAAATPVGNTYTLVEYVTDGTYSMATYVATNVQGFPAGSTDPESILNVDAVFPSPVEDAGCLLSSWRGVGAVTAQAIGAHRAAWGRGAGVTTVGPGAIPIGAGSLAYGVTLANALVGREPPAGFTAFAGGADTVFATEGDYAIQLAAGSVNPQWTWYFPDSPSSTWFTTVLALNPAQAAHLEFTVQPRTTLPLHQMTPAVQVTVKDETGSIVTNFNGPVTIAIGRNGGLLMLGTLAGTRTVNAVNGVATFPDLSIDQLGSGYTLVVSGANITGAESASFNVGLM
ncbi:MAG TPA: hypothetical protein VN803_12250 [Gemmatimonadales bacterium]|nr:hypothetical protein [Gemmatimonadales bacterium]